MNLTFDLLKKAQGDEFRNHSVVVGDFNFSHGWIEEEKVITDNQFRDVMHDFVDKEEWTMPATNMFPAWRPDKVVTQTSPTKEEFKKPYWKSLNAEIVGKEAIPSYAAKGEDPLMIN